jgi:hypothetical protein
MDGAPQSRSTPYGTLYRPQRWIVQVPSLFAAFAATLLSGWALGRLCGAASNMGQAALTIPTVVIFFGGYALWNARLAAIAFEGIGAGLLKALFLLVVRRKKPTRDVWPAPEKIEQMAVRAQRAASSFALVAWLTVLPGMALTVFVDSQVAGTTLALAAGATYLAWGHLLAFLGRRGYLPIMESE